MLPARLLFRNTIQYQFVRSISYTPIRKMPFNKHEVVPDVIPTAPKNVAKVDYVSGVSANLGNVLTPTQVKDAPTVDWDAEADAFYTLCMTDPDAPSRQNPEYREWHHWLIGNIPGKDVSKGEVLSDYVGSGPPEKTGFKNCIDLENLMMNLRIEKIETVKYLGAVISNNLAMTSHTNQLVTKISQSVNALSIIKWNLPVFSLMQFYHAFIGSHLFNNGFLICRMNAVDINRLQRIQNKSLKLAFGLKKDFSTNKLFMEVAVNVLPVMGIAVFNLLLLVKKCILANCDDDSDFKFITEGRRINQLKFQRFRKSIFADDFVCLGPRVFNQLPLEIRNVKGYFAFKKKLKKFLLENKIVFLRGSKLDVNNLFHQQNP